MCAHGLQSSGWKGASVYDCARHPQTHRRRRHGAVQPAWGSHRLGGGEAALGLIIIGAFLLVDNTGMESYARGALYSVRVVGFAHLVPQHQRSDTSEPGTAPAIVLSKLRAYVSCQVSVMGRLTFCVYP